MQKNERRKICRYYVRGKCVKQDCPFVHQQQTKKPCKFWTQTGFCRKGKNCQFYHATKQEEKKDNKYLSHHQETSEQKIQRNFTGQIKQAQQKINKQADSDESGQTELKPKQKIEQSSQEKEPIDDQANLKIKQQLLKELEEGGTEKIQFFKQYPKSFPDYSKTPEVKEHIKKVEQKYFNGKPFLQILKQLSTKQEQQYYQIIRRYQDSFRLEDQNEPKVYFINLRPLLFSKQISLHFPFEELYFHLKINQKLYPQTCAHIQILNESIPTPYKRKFEDLFKKYHAKHNLFDTLKFFQNSFEKNYETAKFKLQNEHYKRLELKQKIEQEKQRIKQKSKQKKQEHLNHKNHHHEHQLHKKHQEGQRDGQKKQGVFDKNHEQKVSINPPQMKGQSAKNIQQGDQNQKSIRQYRDYFELDFDRHQKPQYQNLNEEITVESLVMVNCPYLVLEKILLYIECNCSKILMYLFDAKQKKELKLWVKLKCKKCSGEIRIVWDRLVIHNQGNLISRMSVVNGKLVDIGGLSWKIGCDCDEQILKNKLLLPGERLQLNCHNCFSNMSITYNGLKHFNPFIKQFQLQQNKELPLKGSCNHDKFSFRWIRYACCGRPFSCEECHDLGSVKIHEIVNGLTMICGHCSFEQSLAEICFKCKKQLLKGQDKAGYWEGGMGCRDQLLLSKKDAKKYAGMSKVQSNNNKKKKQK